jgi:transcriptional regulator with XRE-family HTH domain
MARTFDSPRQKALRDFLVKKRKEAGLRQVDLAKRLKRRQDYISHVETGQKLVEVVELMEWAEAIGFDAWDAIKALGPTDGSVRHRRMDEGALSQCAPQERSAPVASDKLLMPSFT